MSRRTKKPKREFSKLILYVVGAVTVGVTAFTLIMVWKTENLEPLAYLIPAIFAELATATGFTIPKPKPKTGSNFGSCMARKSITMQRRFETMLNAVLNNLINIGWAMLIFLCAYLSNVAFSLYYNIKVLLQPFDRQKMINSGLKVATFVVGLTLLCVAITTLPIYADQLGWAIPEEYTEIFADLVIVGAVLMVSCKYIAEAFTKFRAILQVKGDTENE